LELCSIGRELDGSRLRGWHSYKGRGLAGKRSGDSCIGRELSWKR